MVLMSPCKAYKELQEELLLARCVLYEFKHIILPVIKWNCTHKSKALEYFNAGITDQNGILKTQEIELNGLILFEFLL